MSAPTVLIDTDILVKLSKVKRIDLLLKLRSACGWELGITDVVHHEIIPGSTLRRLVDNMIRSGLLVKHEISVHGDPQEVLLVDRLGKSLQKGEASTYAVALVRGYDVASDDQTAYTICWQELGEVMKEVEWYPLLRLMFVCHRNGKLSIEEADRILEQLRSKGYRFKRSVEDGGFCVVVAMYS